MSGLQGHLELLCAPDERGVSSLQRQSFRAPFHLSKPHLHAGTLVVNVANPTAGFLAGDRARVRVEVAAGGALLLTTPAANRAFRVRGGEATLEQEFLVAAGGWLEVLPEIFIPHAGARYRQRTTLRVEPGGEALFFEALAPGRTAAGESFAYAALRWETEVWFGDRLAARERYLLEPTGMAVRALQRRFPEAYYASCFVLTSLGPDHPCWRQLETLQGADLWLGCSALACGGSVVKLLASNAVSMRRGLAVARQTLYAGLGRTPPDLRRVQPSG